MIAVGLGTAVILLTLLLWPTGSRPNAGSQVTPASEAVPGPPPATSPEPSPNAPVAARNPAPAAPLSEKATAAVATPPLPGATRIELAASEPSWVSIRGGDGSTQMSGLIGAGKSQTVDIREPAILRAGNAGGLTIRAYGKSLGPLGPHGAIREVEFNNGDFKPVPIQ